jgi:hypothetical protein
VRRLALAALALSACSMTPQVAVNPRADFGSVRRVAVVAFSGPQGEAAAELLREQRLGSSGTLDPATVRKVGRILGVDALFVGTVVQSLPEQSYLVTSAPENVLTQVTPVSRANLAPGLPLMGVPNSQVVTAAASASLVSRMVSVETGSILWSASMSYDGLDTASALRAITGAFVESLLPVWPELRRPKR